MSGRVLGFRADEDLASDVDEYQDSRGIDEESKALEELVRVGLRERQGPIRSTWRERVHDWSGLLAILAMVVLAAGVVAPAHFEPAVQLSAVMLMLALAMLGVLEFARTVSGQSWLAASVFEVLFK